MIFLCIYAIIGIVVALVFLSAMLKVLGAWEKYGLPENVSTIPPMTRVYIVVTIFGILWPLIIPAMIGSTVVYLAMGGSDE